MDYEVRPFLDRDLDDVVDLLGASFHTWSAELAREFFVWKHLQNPAGRSSMWVTLAGGQVVAFRAAMRWPIEIDGSRSTAMRGADAVTHGDHRRKGLWRLMTERAVEEWTDGGGCLAFAHGNAKTRAGYEAMGWRALGELVPVAHINRWTALARALRGPDARRVADLETRTVPLCEALAHPGIDGLVAGSRRGTSGVQTAWTREMLAWRYGTPREDTFRALSVELGSQLVGLVVLRFRSHRGVVVAHIESTLHDREVPASGERVARACRALGFDVGLSLDARDVWGPMRGLSGPLRRRAVKIVAQALGDTHFRDRAWEDLSDWRLEAGDLPSYF